MERIVIPAGPGAILAGLAAGGYTAYIVGGCVRDALLGRTPHDWDICTSARPQQVASCFPELRVVPTGIRHGTVTVLRAGAAYEVTTYRVDGPYSDGRRPDTVRFVDQLPQDLARRDFTINAMAADPDGRVVDLYGGRSDLAAGLVRCVGNPDTRFAEDALRMLRAARFASQCGFAVEEQTAQSIHHNRALLSQVAAERIRAELERLLLGTGVERALLDFPDLLAVFWPQLSPAVNGKQPDSRWVNTARAVAHSVPDLTVRLTLIILYLRKSFPFTCHVPDDNFTFQVEKMMQGIRLDRSTTTQVTQLINWCGTPLDGDRRRLKDWLARLGGGQLARLIQVKRAMLLAQGANLAGQELKELEGARAGMDDLLASGSCFRVDQLAVDGRDLKALGVAQGPEIGELLRALLVQVMDGRVDNQREALIQAARAALEETG